MNYTNLLKIALRAIAANKLRAFLTALGIIIGVASVITMLAIGQGSKRSIQANIAEMGSNMIMIHPGADMRGGVRQDASAMETLKLTDYESIKDECNYIKGISPMVSKSGQWIYGNNNTPSSIYGVNQDYLEIRQLSVSDGEVFTDADIKSSAKVCILGQTVVDNLFPDGADFPEPLMKGGEVQLHPLPRHWRAKEEGLQLHGNGPGRPCACSIHNGDEAHPRTDIPREHTVLGCHGGCHRQGHRADYDYTAP